jgi:hypothetical protein
MDDYTISVLDAADGKISDVHPFIRDVAEQLVEKLGDIIDFPSDMIPEILAETLNILTQRQFESIQQEVFDGIFHEYENIPPYTWDEFQDTGMPEQPDTPQPIEGVDYILEPTNSFE